jgi:hypothetical protein
VQAWIAAISTVLVTLSVVFGAMDPFRPAWTCCMVLAVSVMAGALTVWTGRGSAVYASGLLFNVAGALWWIDWQTAGSLSSSALISRFVWVQALCFGAASLLWSIIEIGCRRLERMTWSTPVPFRHVACWLGLGVVTGWTFFNLGRDWMQVPWSIHDPLAWFALAAVVCAAVAMLWDEPDERLAWPLPQLYVLGLVAIGLGLHTAGPGPRWLTWGLSVAAGAYILDVALLGALCLRNSGIGERLGMRARPAGWPLQWLLPALAITGSFVAVSGLWIVLTFDGLDARLAGALSVAGLLGAALVLAPHAPRLLGAAVAQSPWPRYTALLLGALVCVLLHGTLVGPSMAAPWLHRTVLLMAALTWVAVGYGLALPRWLGPTSLWSQTGRRLAVPLGIAVCLCPGTDAVAGIPSLRPQSTHDSTGVARGGAGRSGARGTHRGGVAICPVPRSRHAAAE